MLKNKLCLRIPKNLLTRREEEVLLKVLLGKNNTEIAKELIISVHTAKVHVCSILQKMGVTRRACIAVKALTEGWLVVRKLNT